LTRTVLLTVRDAVPTLKEEGRETSRSRGLAPESLRPMLWKELRQERRNLLRQGCSSLFMLALGVSVIYGWCGYFLAEVWRGAITPAQANLVPRLIGGPVAGVLLLTVAVTAAGRVTRERERRTLDSLLATPLDPREIVGAKWLAS